MGGVRVGFVEDSKKQCIMSYYGLPPASEEQMTTWLLHLTALQDVAAAQVAAKPKKKGRIRNIPGYSNATSPQPQGYLLSGAAGQALRKLRNSTSEEHTSLSSKFSPVKPIDSTLEDEEPSELEIEQTGFAAWCSSTKPSVPKQGSAAYLEYQKSEQLKDELRKADSPSTPVSSQEKLKRVTYFGAVVTTLKGHEGPISCLCTLADGRLASGSEDNTIKVWSASEAKLITSIDTGLKSVYCLATLPDLDTIASGADRDISIWKISTGVELRKFAGHSAYVWGMSMVKLVKGDEGVLASVSADKSLRLWCLNEGDRKYGECISVVEEHRDSVYSLAVFPDQYSFATGSADTTIKIWKPAGTSRHYNCSVALKGHSKLVYSLVAVSAKYLASASDDWTIRIWNTENGVCLHKLDAHQEAVTCLGAFLGSDGAQAPILFSGSRDCDAKIWNLSDMKVEQTLAGHRDEVLCLSVLLATSSSGVVATGCEDGTINVWGIMGQ